MTTEPPRRPRRPPSLDRVEAMSDPIKQAVAVERFLTATRPQITRAIRIRKAALRTARETGMTPKEIIEQTRINENTVRGDLR